VDQEGWLSALARELPEVDVRVWPHAGRLEDIGMAFVWRHPAGMLRALPNLRALFSLGAGVERILSDPELPPSLPIVRMVDPGLAVGMNEFVLMSVLHYHRQMHLYQAQQSLRIWADHMPPMPEDRRVGILGLGQLGGICADTLVGMGFDVAGWSRTPQTRKGVHCFCGDGQLPAFLRRTQILVCLLPLTPATRDILGSNHLAMLPRGASVINVGRGGHVVDEDLIAALDAGHLEGATLDVFREEPVPQEHPFWSHPKIRIVPHVSAVTQIKTAAPTLAANVRRLLAGEPLHDVVDRNRGY
jgi:glyoxylate/hydroxypyruvate reductase A